MKIYRGVEPRERQRREVEALALAAQWGVAVPEVLAAGVHLDRSWTVFSAVPGYARRMRTDGDVRQHLCDVRALTERLAAAARRQMPGAGWGRSPGDRPGHRRFLLGQLSQRCRRYGWWNGLSASLGIVDCEPTVYLHGDLKADHFLIAPDEIYVVDWEACGRGPAVCDSADVVFHVVRDLLYNGGTAQPAVISSLADLGTPGAVLAWRLLRWLDRRRPQDLNLISPQDIHELAVEADAEAACKKLVQAIACLRTSGVPR